MTKKNQTTHCGDWHLGWGYGYTKIGNLSIEIVPDCPINFVWKGSSQGRHGNVHWKGGNTRFMVISKDHIAVTYMKKGYPASTEVVKAMNTLLRQNKIHIEISGDARFELRIPTEYKDF